MMHLRQHEQRKGLETLVNMSPSGVMVEVGSYAGASTKIFAQSNKFSAIHAVDPWKTGYDNKHDYVSRHSGQMKEAEGIFDDILAEYPCIHKIRTTSVEAVVSFEDNSLDLVYIDACHKYKSMWQDITIWLPKVKQKTGWFAGHDFCNKWHEVRQAILEALGEPHHRFIDSSWAFEVGKLA